MRRPASSRSSSQLQYTTGPACVASSARCASDTAAACASPAPPPLRGPLRRFLWASRASGSQRVTNHCADGQTRRVRLRCECRSRLRLHRHAQLCRVPRFASVTSFCRCRHTNTHVLRAWRSRCRALLRLNASVTTAKFFHKFQCFVAVFHAVTGHPCGTGFRCYGSPLQVVRTSSKEQVVGTTTTVDNSLKTKEKPPDAGC